MGLWVSAALGLGGCPGGGSTTGEAGTVGAGTGSSGQTATLTPRAPAGLDLASFPLFVPSEGALPVGKADDEMRPQVRFSPDGRLLLACCTRVEGGAKGAWRVHLWDVEQGKVAGAFEHVPVPGGDPGAPWVSWSPKGSRIVVDDNHVVSVLLADTLKKVREVPADYSAYSIDPKDQRMAWGRTNEDTFLIDLARGKTLAKNAPGGAATGLFVDIDWSPEGGRVLADGQIWRRDGGRAVSWEKATGERWPGDVPLGWSWTEDGKTLLVATGGKLTALDAEKGSVAWTAKEIEPPIAIHPGGDMLAFVAPTGTIGMFLFGGHGAGGTFTDDPPEPYPPRDEARFWGDAIRFSKDGARFVVQRTFSPVRVCTTAEHRCIRLPFETRQNTPPPVWRGADLFVQAGATIALWSPEEGGAFGSRRGARGRRRGSMCRGTGGTWRWLCRGLRRW
ncbi:MAG: WD40 repeat domain-containing protein [Polyangiaceae bacterium]